MVDARDGDPSATRAPGDGGWFNGQPAAAVTRADRARSALAHLLLAGLALLCVTSAAARAATATPTATPTATAVRPCDVYAVAGTPCVAAYSTTRAMYAAYTGPLYAIRRSSDASSLTIGTLAGGYADAGAQDRFCAGTRCEITELFDQSPDGNNLLIEGPGTNGGQDRGVNADALPVTVDGHEAYGMSFAPGTGYRDDVTRGMAVGAEPEAMYMVTSGRHYDHSCCFDFGNAETTASDTGNGHMDAIYFGSDCWAQWPFCGAGGPWVQADLENGLIGSSAGTIQDAGYTGSTSPFVTAMLENNGTNDLVLAAADAQAQPLGLIWDGSLPTSHWNPNPPAVLEPSPADPLTTMVVNPPLSGYEPMHKEGAIVLGTGGDDSNGGAGDFFEGAITAGMPVLGAEDAVQTDIAAAGYATSVPGADIPRVSVQSRAGQAVAAIDCPVTCAARASMTVSSARVSGAGFLRTAVPSVVRTLSGTGHLALVIPPKVLKAARASGLHQLSATVLVHAATARPGTPGTARTVHLAIAL